MESRLTPAGLGLALTTPQLPLLAEVASAEGNTSPTLSLQLSSPGQSVGTASGLLSLGVNLDMPILPPVAIQAGVGSGQSAISLGVTVVPPVTPPAGILPTVGVTVVTPPATVGVSTQVGSGESPILLGVTVNPPATPPLPDGILPTVGATVGVTINTPPATVGVSVGTPPPVATTPPPVATTPPAGPSASLPFASSASTAAFAPTLAFQTTSFGTNSQATFSVDEIESPVTPPAESDNDAFDTTRIIAGSLTSIESFLTMGGQAVSATRGTPSAESDELTDELFELRDGALLEDFGMAIGEGDAAGDVLSIESTEGEVDSALSLWLLGVLAGCAAGSAYLNRRKAEVIATPDVDPCLIPAI